MKVVSFARFFILSVAVLASFTSLPHLLPAQQLDVIHDEVDPQWSEDGLGFWYKAKLADRGSQYVLVDAAAGTREPLFDHETLAKAITKETGRQTDSRMLPIRIGRFDSQQQTVTLSVGGKPLVLNRKTNELAWGEGEIAAPGMTLFLPPQPSGTSEQAVNFAFTNRLDREVEVVWVDPSRNLQPYAKVAAGEDWSISSYATHVWLFRTTEGEPLGCLRLDNASETKFELNRETVDSVERQGRGSGRQRRRPNRGDGGPQLARGNTSPSGEWSVESRDHNLWLVRIATEGEDNLSGEMQLTTDATEKVSFRASAQRARLMQMQYERQDFPENTADVAWSADSKYLIAWQTKQVPERTVNIVKSLTDNLQPELISYPYAKPGDELPNQRPRLFNVAEAREIPIEGSWFDDPWDVRLERISPDSTTAWFYYNQRGHQRIQVVKVDLATGKAVAVIDESSSTFLHYSDGAKYSLRWLDDTTALWSSERSGWNHLYRINMMTGEVLNEVTEGDWNVKRIEEIRDGQVWFYAVGIAPDQDPYHEHFCRVNIDGTNMIRLTEGDGMHTVTLSPKRDFLLDQYSRVDLPPVHELRRTSDGSLVCEVERAEVSSGDLTREQVARLLPQRFVAPGRDGKTPIWGIVHWPADFDPAGSYPVIEAIYAGPHGYHVPKTFRGNRSHSSFTSAGFVVVQIDGMGTAWRSKAFHDVCYRNLRDAGFPDRVAWIKALGAENPALDLSRVGIFGGSAGGQNAMAALLWHNDFYKVAVADCGCHDNRMDKVWWNEQWMGKVEPGNHYAENSNMENAHLLQGHLMLVVGELDKNVDPATTTQVAAKLIAADKDFVMLLIPGAGHGACESPYGRKRRLEFFRQHLGDAGTE